MTMSKDRVEFWLAERYFQNYSTKHNNGGMERETCQRVLERAFNMSTQESSYLMNGFPHGFTIRCRPSQFARFIVYRHELGQCINGIKDLNPKLMVPEELNLYERVSRDTGELLGRVNRILEAAGTPNRREDPSHNFIVNVDVSKRPAE